MLEDSDCEKTATVEMFYPRDGKNHPGGDQTPAGEGSGRSPNWFYYWNKEAGDPGDALFNDQTGNYGVAPAMLHWSNTMNYSKTEIWIDTPSAGSDTRRDGSGQTVTGIDLFANVVKHENYHVEQIASADALLGTLNGKAGSIWLKGWSWNHTPHNHWTLGPDDKPGDAGVDDDNDGTTDEDHDHSEVGFVGSDDVSLDANSNNVPDQWEPYSIEGEAGDQETVAEDTHWQKDWGNPGKQHRTNRKYDD